MNALLAKVLKTTLVIAIVAGFSVAPLAAQNEGATNATQAEATDNTPAPSDFNSLKSLAAFGAGIVVVGAAIGIGMIGSGAVAGISRQPEASGDMRTTMIIAAALIEGVALFALIICLIVGG